MAETIIEPRGSVQSRVSWGALLAGAAVGVATYTVLAMFGLAIGLTAADGVDRQNIGIGVGIWAFLSLIVAMFFAGWVSTQCTAGESRTEAVLYGVVVWAITSTFLVWSAANGMGLSQATFAAERQVTARQVAPPDARDAGAQDGMAEMFGEDRQDRLQAMSWWAFCGTVVSLGAAIGGALLGPYEFVPRSGYRTRTTAGEP